MSLIAAALALAASSDATPLRKVATATDLLSSCKPAVMASSQPPKTDLGKMEAEIAEGLCNAFILGAVGMHEMLVITAKIERKFCLPLSVDNDKLRRAVGFHAELAISRKVDDASFAVLEALEMGFPCEKQSK